MNERKLVIKDKKGITLVALIITIVVLLILVTVSIRILVNQGIIGRANNAKDVYLSADIKEQLELAKQGYRFDHLGTFDARDFVNNIGSYIKGAEKVDGTETTIKIKGKLIQIESDGRIATATANAPELKQGMVPVKYDKASKCWVVTKESDPEWYNYAEYTTIKDGIKVEGKKWANVMLQDGLEYDNSTGKVIKSGSMFVWIPRYAYKITKLTEKDYITTVNGNSISRVTTKAGKIDVIYLKDDTDNYEGGKATRGNKAEAEYVVHPSFTNDMDLGGWDKELPGYWVAKYDATYEGEEGNPDSAKDSTISYTSNYNNIVSNYYGENQIKEGEIFKKIKYPCFKVNKSAFNYISVGDCYSLCLSLNSETNPYGIDSTSDIHLMKNSEWGAVAYLGHSKYGKNGQEIGGSSSLVTGSSGSTTNNIYGIYDLSGGAWERISGYVNNGNLNITKYGESMITQNSTKYITLYEVGNNGDNIVSNYIAAKKFYGDAITETALYDETKEIKAYNAIAGWFNDSSTFPNSSVPFFARGRSIASGVVRGSFAFAEDVGQPENLKGFRTVIT